MIDSCGTVHYMAGHKKKLRGEIWKILKGFSYLTNPQLKFKARPCLTVFSTEVVPSLPPDSIAMMMPP